MSGIGQSMQIHARGVVQMMQSTGSLLKNLKAGKPSGCTRLIPATS